MSELASLTTAVAPVRSRYRPLIDEAGRWAVEHGAPVDADLFALVCAGRSDDSDRDPIRGWTRADAYRLLRIGIPNWCSHSRCPWPLEVVPATWRWFDFLHGTRRMGPTSDPLWELRKPLICYGGLDFDGSPRPVDDPSPIPCECFLPYRESVDYLNRELQRAEWGGHSPAWETPDPALGGFEPATLGRRWTITPPPPPRRGRSGPGATRRRRPATKRR
ncbi:MAG: hypothetical protein J2P20_13895 [Pseudonocardia sp.]|nr:hypothetical protein [Pseudonocardia sp.]